MLLCKVAMLKIAYHPVYIHPLPPGHRFPMLKYELIPLQLIHQGVITEKNLFAPGTVDERDVLLCHKEDYWRRLRSLTLTAKEQRRTGFVLSELLLQRELCIAQGTIDSALFALENGLSFNVAGGTHHAGSDWGEGFCLLNDQAIAAGYLLKNKMASSILIIDLDVHQGNGTAEIFSNDKRVFTLSIHGQKNFPFNKEQSDLDVGLDDDTMDAEYLDIVNKTLDTALDAANPDFVFYLSGVDILSTDKLGRMKISHEACRRRDELVFSKCRQRGLPVQVSMGGGYSPDIKNIVDAHCNTFKAGIDSYF